MDILKGRDLLSWNPPVSVDDCLRCAMNPALEAKSWK